MSHSFPTRRSSVLFGGGAQDYFGLVGLRKFDRDAIGTDGEFSKDLQWSGQDVLLCTVQGLLQVLMQERGIPRTRDALYGLVIGPRCRKRPTPDFVDDPRRRERRFAGRGENERAEWAHVGRDRDQIHEVAGLPPSGRRNDREIG